jgi:hypothetical protein
VELQHLHTGGSVNAEILRHALFLSGKPIISAIDLAAGNMLEIFNPLQNICLISFQKKTAKEG